MKNKIKQCYSIMLNKRTNIFIALALGLFIVATVFFGGIIMNLLAGSKLDGVDTSIYQAMLMIIDPGFLAVDRGFWIGLVSLLVVLVGMVVFLGGSIGYICTLLSNFMDSVKGDTGEMILLGNRMDQNMIELHSEDKVIVYCRH